MPTTNMVGAILGFLDWMQKRKAQQFAPVIGEIANIGQGGAADTYGPEAVTAALKAQGITVPTSPMAGIKMKGPSTGQVTTPVAEGTPQWQTPDVKQQSNLFLRGLQTNRPEDYKTIMERQVGLRAPAATEEAMAAKEQYLGALKSHWDDMQKIQTSALEERTKYHENLLSLNRQINEAKDETARSKITSQIDTLNQKYDYQTKLQQNLFDHQMEMLKLKLEGKENLTPDKLATVTGKIRDDARSMAMNSTAAMGYGNISIINGTPQMMWKDSVNGPKMFESEYEKFYNQMVDEHSKIGVNLPKIGVEKSKQNKRVEKATKEALKGELERQTGPQKVGVPLEAKEKAQVIKMISDLKAKGTTTDSIIKQMSEAGIDPDSFMEYLK